MSHLHVLCLFGIGVLAAASPVACAPPPAADVDCSDQKKKTLACDGVCVDPKTDDANCGSCGTDCGDVGDGFACFDGHCAPDDGSCTATSIVCGDGDQARCVDADTDSANCGACDKACGASEACVDGSCSTCPSDHPQLCTYTTGASVVETACCATNEACGATGCEAAP